MRTTFHTAIATLLVLSVIASASIRILAIDHPFLVALAGVALSAAAGSYRGLRLTEFLRFRRRPTIVRREWTAAVLGLALVAAIVTACGPSTN